MSSQERPPTEEELRAAYEAQVKQLRVDDLLIETVVSLVNLAGRKAGLAPGTEDEKDLEQVRLAIEAVTSLLPLVEPRLGPDAPKVRDVISQLQLAYAQQAGAAAEAGQGAAEGSAPPPPAEPPQGPPSGPGHGPAQSSGRLWVPGQ
ncbi:MAG TPA: hypothetical protein VD931_10990 [Baekduia sp.]|nr:hypothetical protein [Baekduia sp.]